MKFDVILANPPYDNGLHEKFSIKYFDICDGEICWVSPLSFLLGKKQNKKLTVHLDKYATDIEQINGNEYFDAVINGTIGIVHINMHGIQKIKFDSIEYKKCEEISSYSNDKLLVEFKNIIEPLYTKNNLQSYLKYTPGNTQHALNIKRHTENNPNENWYILNITSFGAGVQNIGLFSKSNILTGIYKDLVTNSDKRIVNYYFAFNTKQELNNFINYSQSYFCRTSLYLFTKNVGIIRGELEGIPWFDFSDPIFDGSPEEIDMVLFKKYNISQEIINHILEILPNYYDLDLTKYEGQD